jgi:hypothetical protein
MKRLLSVIAMLLLCSLPVIAADVSLAWDASSSPNVAGYKIYAGNESGKYNAPATIGNQTAYTVKGLGPGTWYFAVTAFNSAGGESGFSNEVSTTIKEPAPVAPGNLKITVTVEVQIK